jgi:hypothetical protein
MKTRSVRYVKLPTISKCKQTSPTPDKKIINASTDEPVATVGCTLTSAQAIALATNMLVVATSGTDMLLKNNGRIAQSQSYTLRKSHPLTVCSGEAR